MPQPPARYFVGANVLLRLAEPAHAHHSAPSAVRALLASGALLYVAPQCIYEYWVVASKPIHDRDHECRRCPRPEGTRQHDLLDLGINWSHIRFTTWA